jgi:outer membrane biosynthesis protein TonB
MNLLLKYIQGQRKGKDAHRIEREAMQDPFLAEALEGFEAMDGLHVERIMSIRKRLSSQTRRTYLSTGRLAAAAGLLLCILGGSYFLLNHPASDSFMAQSENPAETVAEEIPFPAPSRRNIGNACRQRETAPAMPETLRKPPPLAENDSLNENEMEIVSGREGLLYLVAKEETATGEVISLPDTAVAETGMPEARRKAKVNHVPEESIEKDSSFSAPEPQIGMKAYREYLAKELIRPSEGRCAGMKGTVEIQFRMDARGRPYDFTIKRGLCAEADREAIRLIGQGSPWKGDPSQPVTVEVTF